MPDGTHYNAIVRQWEMLKLLPSKGPGVTVKTLVEQLTCKGYIVHRRTIERDLVTLSTMFSIVCNDKGTPSGWHWMPGESADLPSLSIADAVSLQLVEELVRPLLPSAVLESLEPRLRQARTSLEAMAEVNKRARWIDKVRHVSPTMPLLPPCVDAGILETLQEALLLERQVDVLYLSPQSDAPLELRLHPLGLVQRGPIGYLVATAFQYSDVRLYAVHRFQQAVPTREPIQTPREFSLDDFIAEGSLHFGDGKRIKFEAIVSEGLLAILAETPLSIDQKISSKAGQIRVKATLIDSWQLTWWILSYGPALEILRPSGLRKRISEQLNEAASLYSSE
jgi:predicted DNA-binding transcriptional regulator YafY